MKWEAEMRRLAYCALGILLALGALLLWWRLYKPTTVEPHTRIHVASSNLTVWTYLPVIETEHDGQQSHAGGH
jgi:hypothetical protein